MKWMSLPDEYSTKESSFFEVLPISYEKDVTFCGGTSKGPFEIVKASQHLEYYDEEFDCEAFEAGIYLHPILEIFKKSPLEMLKIVSETLNPAKFTITLGGDHAVTLGAVRSYEREHEKFSVIILDAHADLRDSWNGSAFNHACVSKQLSKKHKLLLVGVRAMDSSEMIFAKQTDSVKIIKSHDFSIEKIKQTLLDLEEKVYLSIDVDVFDPSFISMTGTPEPGGFLWKEVMSILKEIFLNKTVIGCDIVEFSPREHAQTQAYCLARLAYKLMSLRYQKIYK